MSPHYIRLAQRNPQTRREAGTSRGGLWYTAVMPWPRFILVVVVGSLLVSASIFLLGPRVFNATQAVSAGLLPQWMPDVVSAFLVDVPALIICTVPAVAVTALVALHRRRDDDCRCRKCGYILRGISEPRCPECGERI